MAAPRKPAAGAIELEVDGIDVRFTSPDRIYFPETGATKLDVARYYQAVGPGIVNALRERPCMMHRFPEGLSGEKVHQKRVPRGRRHGSRRCRCTSLDTTGLPTSCA
ncbi:MAG: hypothetical protein WKF58_18390 [Ilumatobacteraceae bacterium]